MIDSVYPVGIGYLRQNIVLEDCQISVQLINPHWHTADDDILKTGISKRALQYGLRKYQADHVIHVSEN